MLRTINLRTFFALFACNILCANIGAAESAPFIENEKSDTSNVISMPYWLPNPADKRASSGTMPFIEESDDAQNDPLIHPFVLDHFWDAFIHAAIIDPTIDSLENNQFTTDTKQNLIITSLGVVMKSFFYGYQNLESFLTTLGQQTIQVTADTVEHLCLMGYAVRISKNIQAGISPFKYYLLFCGPYIGYSLYSSPSLFLDITHEAFEHVSIIDAIEKIVESNGNSFSTQDFLKQAIISTLVNISRTWKTHGYKSALSFFNNLSTEMQNTVISTIKHVCYVGTMERILHPSQAIDFNHDNRLKPYHGLCMILLGIQLNQPIVKEKNQRL